MSTEINSTVNTNKVSKTAVIINTNSDLGLAVLRNVCANGYNNVISISIENDNKIIDKFYYTNPEFRNLINYVYININNLNNPNLIISNSTILKNLHSIDLLISLNPTDDIFIKWDLDLLKKIYTDNLLNKNSIVIISRASEKTIYTTNKTLEIYTENIENVLTKNNIYVSNMIQLGSMKGDENYVADTLINEIYRPYFKTENLNSFNNILSFLVYYLMPGFLLKFSIDLSNYFNSYFKKEKKD